MQKTLKEAFVKAKYEPNADLPDYIWQKIITRNKRIKSFKISIFSSFGILSIAGLVPVFNSLFNEFSQSGSYEYLSLLFSGNGEISLYWKELLMSIAESLPTINIIYALTLIFILFISLRYMAKQILKDGLSIREFRTLS